MDTHRQRLAEGVENLVGVAQLESAGNQQPGDSWIATHQAGAIAIQFVDEVIQAQSAFDKREGDVS